MLYAYVGEERNARIDVFADHDMTSRSAIVRDALDAYFGEEEKNPLESVKAEKGTND